MKWIVYHHYAEESSSYLISLFTWVCVKVNYVSKYKLLSCDTSFKYLTIQYSHGSFYNRGGIINF